VLSYSSANITLHSIQAEHIEQLREWRNHPDIRSQMRDQSLISAQQQQQWFASLAKKVNEQHFIAYYAEQPMGYANLKLLQPGIYETGLYVGLERYRGSVVSFLLALCQIDYAFERLNAQALHAEVKPTNHAALRFNQQLGYQVAGEQAGYQVMHLSPEDYQCARARLARFIR